MQTVSRMLTVRRMFSLLHYRVILARKGPNVKDFFLPFSEYSAPGLGIVDSGHLWCRSADNWEFAGLFGQWCAVSMRYTALPPALVRGVSLRQRRDGGSTNFRKQSVNSIIFLCLPFLFFALFCEGYAGDALPPVPVCGLVPPPSQVRGARTCTASPRKPFTKQLYTFQFVV